MLSEGKAVSYGGFSVIFQEKQHLGSTLISIPYLIWGASGRRTNQTGANGRWVGLALKRAKKKAGAGAKKKPKKKVDEEDEEDVSQDRGIYST
jgi:hypothetical protein